MNIAFFLIPKDEIEYLNINCTMRQALEKMEYHRYTAIPLIDNEGKYAGTLTEGDLLWKIKNTPNFSFSCTEKIRINSLERHFTNHLVRIDSEIEDLMELVIGQNFVPVVDDQNIFIGIVRRREIISFLAKNLKETKNT